MSYLNMQRPPFKQAMPSSTDSDLTKVLWELHNDDPGFGGRIQMHHLARGEVLADAAALKRQIYVLMQGEVHLVYANEGRRLVVAALEPGAIFGEGALANPGNVNVVAEAATDAKIWSVPATEARVMAIQYPILGWGLLQTYGKRLQQLENSLEDVAYKRLPTRLAALLVGLSKGQNGAIQGISHQELAERLGTYRETVSAMLREFKRQGLVKLGYRRIDVIDAEALTEAAEIWSW